VVIAKPLKKGKNIIAADMQKILEGDLAGFAVPDILSLLNMGQRTGVFVLERPDEESKLFVREGSPVFAVATRPDLRLGSMLIRMGRLKAQDLDRVLARQHGGAQRLGEMLLIEKVLTAEELASFLKVQVSEVIFDTFTWRQGAFAFYDHVPPPSAVVTLEMDLQNLIMEGVRRIDERGRVDEVFPDRAMAVEAVANPERVKHSVTFTPEEWQVFFLIDGRRTIDEICRLAGNPDELYTLRILYRLKAAKFIALTTPVAEKDDAVMPPPVAAEKGVTQAFLDGKPMAVATPTPFSIEFQPAAPRRPDDDTREIVTPKAIQYQKGAKELAVSRLVLVKKGEETSFPLVKDSYTLGRHRNNDIVISDPKVSSFHARLDRSPEGFKLVDLKSRNGCWVNGKRVESALLKTGDEVRLGPAKLTYKMDYQTPVS
jgi:hypothetical protein